MTTLSNSYLRKFPAPRLGAAAVTAAAVLSLMAADVRAIELRPDSTIPPATPLSGPSLTDKLKKGGLVIYVRHERATREAVDRHAAKPNPGCEQSNSVSRSGGERALGNRVALKQLALPIGKVFSSPYCRTTETAQLIFDVVPRLTNRLDAVHATAERLPEQMRKDAVALINEESAANTNLVLVGHREGIMALTGIDVNTGDAVVLEPIAGGVPRVVGVVTALRWAQLGSDAVRREAVVKTAALR